MIIVLAIVVLATLVVIGYRRRQGQSVLVPAIILGAVVLIGVSILIAYIQMFLLLILAVLGLLVALRGRRSSNSPTRRNK